MDQLNQTSEYLKALAHPLRLQIIRTLGLHRQMSVTQLADLCKTESPLISSHLRLLKDRGLLRKQRRGREVFYRVSPSEFRMILNCFAPEL